MPALLVVYHEGYLTDYYTSVAECPARMRAINVKLAGRFPMASPAPAEREDLLRVHSPALIEQVQAEGSDIFHTALLAAGGAIRASQEAMRGTPAFAVVRPPGHHAGPDQYRGFCFFNNVAIAVARLRAARAVERVLILDLDLHSGDGTELIFQESRGVSVVNVRAENRTSYLRAVEELLQESSEVDLLAVSAGFDTYVQDWGSLLHTEDYRLLGGMIGAFARRVCGGRYFAVLEGGYYLTDLGKNVLAFCEGLAER